MKTVDEIYEEMLACFARETGLEGGGGCDLSARLYAVAAQVYALYAQGEWVRRQAFPQTAGGEYLDLHAQLRGLERKQATQAQGEIRFLAETEAEADRVIPAGTVCLTAGFVRFETTEDGILPAGSLAVNIPARAVLAGSGGNTAAGTVTTMAVAPVGIERCTNPQAFAGGGDQETDEGLRARVLETFRRLPNGANAAFYQQEALSFDAVAAASVLPRNRGIGTVDVVVATREGVPDAQLLAELTDYFQQRREIAVDVAVLAPEEVTVNVAMKVKPAENSSFDEVARAVRQAVEDWFTGQRLGQDVLRVELGNLAYGSGLVSNYTISAPAADVAIQTSQLPVLGTLTVEELA